MNLTTPLDDLMPGLRGHVLTVLLRSPQPLTGREVARRAGTVSHSSVKLVLDSLAAAGIVRLSLVSGAGHFYELSNDHVLAEPLRQMDRALDEFLAMAQRLIRSWPAEPVSVALFGSVARGTSTADSDVDLLIVWPDDLSHAPWWTTVRVEFTNQLQDFVGSSVSLVEFSLDDWHEAIESRDPFTVSIRDGGRSVYGADVRDLVAAAAPSGTGMSPARPAKAADGPRHLRVAEEFLAAAKDSLDAGRWSPAVSDAVVAAIRASDAVCAVELRQTWHGLDHGGATGLLVQTSLGTHGAGLLAALLPGKNKGQCTLMPIHEPRARTVYQQASELVDLAADAIRRAGHKPG